MSSVSHLPRKFVSFSARLASSERRNGIFSTKLGACFVSRASMDPVENLILSGEHRTLGLRLFANHYRFRRPATCPDGPPMPSAPGEEGPVAPPDVRPTTAPPAWRTIHQKKKATRRRDAAPPPAPAPAPPPSMPSAPTPMPMPMPMPMPTYIPTAPPASSLPPPSMMDQSRQQSWYAWQRESLVSICQLASLLTILQPTQDTPPPPHQVLLCMKFRNHDLSASSDPGLLEIPTCNGLVSVFLYTFRSIMLLSYDFVMTQSRLGIPLLYLSATIFDE
jgi:hypothetical protein